MLMKGEELNMFNIYLDRERQRLKRPVYRIPRDRETERHINEKTERQKDRKTES